MKVLKQLRLQRGLSQQEMAEYLAVSTGTYSRYETGVREPDYKTLIMLANFFNVTTDYLLGNNHPIPKEDMPDSIGEDSHASLYRRLENATPEQLKYIKAILDADDHREDE